MKLSKRCGALGGELAVAELHLAVAADADEGPLASRRAVAAAPHAGAELDVAQGNGDLLAAVIDMPFVHRPRHVGQGGAVFKGVLLAIPALQQIQLHLAGIEIEGVNLLIGPVAEGICAGGGPL